MLTHYAYYGNEIPLGEDRPQALLKEEEFSRIPELKGKSGALFSEVALNKFLEEDQRHGYSGLQTTEDRSLRTFSSGEKRKALLNHLLKQGPDFLILDSPFDCLDKEAVQLLKKRLEEISDRVVIIQLLKRREELLPFINEVILIEEGRIIKAADFMKLQERSAEQKTPEHFTNIPPAPGNYEGISNVLVEMKGISVNYDGKPVLKNIDWKIGKGEFWELTGPNGSGKSTLLDMIYGDNPKAYGLELFLFGKKKGSGESVWDIKKKIGYFSPTVTELFQRSQTVIQMLVSGLLDSVGLYQKASDRQLSLAEKWLEVLGLQEQRNKDFRSLSLLQQRMILIGRAMIKHPPLLILDEPSTSLDEQSTRMLTRLINSFAEESETAILYVSHRQERGLKPELTCELLPSGEGSGNRIFRS